jgi:hypothetical protein
MKMRSYYLGELTWPDIKQFLAVHDVAVVPLEVASNMIPTCPLTPMPMMLFGFP